jgi:hypothetical protein
LFGPHEAFTSPSVPSALLAEKEVSNVLRITYNTGMKNKFRTVENNIPPTTAVPTECRPNRPAPVAKTRGSIPKMKANDVIRIGRNRNSAASIAALVIDRPCAINC